MATIYKNSGLRMAMQSAVAADVTITAITNADPGVLTSVGHGYNDGDIILLEVQGITELNGRLFVVYAKTLDTFQLEDVDGISGIDTTNFGVFTSGTAKKITLGTTITGVQDFSPQGGDIKFLDTTTVQDTVDKQIVSGATAQSYSLTMQWDPADVAQAAMRAAFEVGAQRGFRIMWQNGTFAMFYGSVGYSGAPGGSSQGITTSPAAIAMNGNPTYGK